MFAGTTRRRFVFCVISTCHKIIEDGYSAGLGGTGGRGHQTCHMPTCYVPTSDPWAWSLDSLLALIGVMIAGLGAIATVLVATLALVATNRANRLEAAARERTGRVALSSAIDAYLREWELEPYFRDSEKMREAARSLTAAAAGVSSSAEDVATWVHEVLIVYVAQIVDEHQDFDTVSGGRLLAIAAHSASSEIRRRVTMWVATGALDRSPLLTPTPAPRLLTN